MGGAPPPRSDGALVPHSSPRSNPNRTKFPTDAPLAATERPEIPVFIGVRADPRNVGRMSISRNRPCTEPIRNMSVQLSRVPSGGCAAWPTICSVTTTTLRTRAAPPGPRRRGRLALPVAGCGCSSDSSSSGGANDPAKAIPVSAPFYLEATVRPTGSDRTDLEAAGRKILRTNDPAREAPPADRPGGPQAGQDLRARHPAVARRQGGDRDHRLRGRPAGVRSGRQLDRRREGRRSHQRRQQLRRQAQLRGHRLPLRPEGRHRGRRRQALPRDRVRALLQAGRAPADKGGDSLASNQDLQDARSATGNRPGFMFVDLQGLLRTVAGSAASSLGPSQLSAINGIFQRFRAFGAGITRRRPGGPA